MFDKIQQYDVNNIIKELEYDNPRPHSNGKWEYSSSSDFLQELSLDYREEQQMKNASEDDFSLEQSLKQENSEEFTQNYNTISNMSSLMENQEIIEPQQNLQKARRKEQKNSPEREQKLNLFYRGYLDYLTSCTWSIYGTSRKYQRSKKRKGLRKRTELETIARWMKCFKGKRLSTAYPKRFDQELNEQFRKLSTKQQAKNDITACALRNVIRNSAYGDNELVLKSFLKKCEQERHWAAFLHVWHNEKKMDSLEDLNC